MRKVNTVGTPVSIRYSVVFRQLRHTPHHTAPPGIDSAVRKLYWQQTTGRQATRKAAPAAGGCAVGRGGKRGGRRAGEGEGERVTCRCRHRHRSPVRGPAAHRTPPLCSRRTRLYGRHSEHAVAWVRTQRRGEGAGGTGRTGVHLDVCLAAARARAGDGGRLVIWQLGADQNDTHLLERCEPGIERHELHATPAFVRHPCAI